MELDTGIATRFAGQRNSTHRPRAVVTRNERRTRLVNRRSLRNRRRRRMHGGTSDLDDRDMAHEIFEQGPGGINFIQSVE